MARITVEDCLKKVNNRFTLIHVASKRVRELRKGDEPTIVSKNRDIVVALREIAAGNVSETTKEEINMMEDKFDILPEELDKEIDDQPIEDKKDEDDADIT
ncbi:MAG: DNA-directed RNA polymerase subunit omega [Deltaproteobacteria bacterium]|jgi:DNA-directed RNA polymerase subunit omega|nr:DNA-directed RNA polymerase subunit omega [Deltaproteobacteria bacterium]